MTRHPRAIDVGEFGDVLKEMGSETRTDVVIEIAASPSGSSVQVPLTVLRGDQVGPTGVLMSGVHGDETPGPIGLSRFLDSIEPSKVRGTIVGIPFANPPAFDHQSRTSPWDDVDLVRIWPGDAEGTVTHRIAYELFRIIGNHADFLVDLHSGTPFIHEFWVLYANRRGPSPEIDERVEEQSRAMADAFGTDQIVRGHPWMTTVTAGGHAGVPTILAEIGGGPDWFANSGHYFEVMQRGLSNILMDRGVLDGAPSSEFEVVDEFDIAEEFKAPDSSRLWLCKTVPGEHVAPGDTVGTLFNPHAGVSRDIVASQHGMVMNPMAPWPHVPPGQWLLATGTHVATRTRGV